MKKLKYLNILFVLLLIMAGTQIVSATDGSDDAFETEDRVEIEKKMIRDRIEKEKRIRLQDDTKLRTKILIEDGEVKKERERTRDNATEKREEIEKRMEDRKEKIEDRHTERAESWRTHTVLRLNTAVERFEKLITRLENRIAKIDEAGGNTVNAKSFITNAQTKLNEAKQKVEEIKVIQIESKDDTNENADLGQSDLVRTILPIAKETQELLKGVREDLVNSIKTLRTDNKQDKLEDNGASDSTNDDSSEQNEQN